jgi:hypothetical protein
VKKLGLIPGMTPVPQASSSSSPQKNTILVPRSEENQVLHSAPIERGVGGIEEISPDGRGTQGTRGVTEEQQRVTEERSSPQKERLKNILQTRRRRTLRRTKETLQRG